VEGEINQAGHWQSVADVMRGFSVPIWLTSYARGQISPKGETTYPPELLEETQWLYNNTYLQPQGPLAGGVRDGW
jgi:hypothetical protein